MNKNYVSEMIQSGYTAKKLDAFHKIVSPYLGNQFFPDKNARILDIGAGGGHCLMPLKSNGWGNLYAVDIEDFNKKFFNEHKIIFSKVDVAKDKLPYNNDFFDAILAFHIIEHLQDSHNFIEEIRRTLKPQGKLLLVTPNWRKQYKTFYRDHTHIHPYDKESIQRLFRCYDFQLIFTKNFGVMRGVGRSGLWKIWPSLMFTGLDMIMCARKS